MCQCVVILTKDAVLRPWGFGRDLFSVGVVVTFKNLTQREDVAWESSFHLSKLMIIYGDLTKTIVFSGHFPEQNVCIDEKWFLVH